MSNIIPTIHQAGVYSVLSPFTLVPETIYECTSLVDFPTLTASGVNVFTIHYEPNNLTKQQYDSDVKNGVVLVTLSTVSQPSIVLPSSYIKSLPKDSLVPFNLFIASACITVPDTTDFEVITAAMKDTISEHFGIEDPDITITQVPTRKYLTSEEANRVEANRVAGITNHGTLRTENSRLIDQVQKLQAQNLAMANILKTK